MNLRADPVLAPYMHWAKTRPAARYDLAGSNVLACSLADLEGAREALDVSGPNDEGYAPLLDAIAARYGVRQDEVATAQGTSGANFLVYAALLSPGDDVLIERPGYDPLVGAARLLGVNTLRYDRPFEERHALDPDRIEAAMTPRTRLIVVTSPHNPGGVIADAAALDEVGRIAAARGAHVLVDEVYMDASAHPAPAAATRGDAFITTSSLTKSYGLSALRCGWILAAPPIIERVRRVRDVVDGTGPVVAERLAARAFAQLDRLLARARALLDPNRALVTSFLRSRPELEWTGDASATVVFPRLRDTADTTAFADRLLRTRGTAVVPGRLFDAPAHVRLGFSGETAALTAGLAALSAELDEEGSRG